MWETIHNLSHRGNLMRRILTFVIVSFMMVLFMTLAASSVTHAANTASWKGNDVIYEGNSFIQKTADGTTPPKLSNNQIYFEDRGNPGPDGSGQTEIIYFIGSIKPEDAKSAQLVKYKLDSSGQFSGNPITGPSSIAIIPKNLAASSSQAGWDGNSLNFDGKKLSGNGTAPFIADGSSAPNLSKDTQYYQLKSNPGANGEGTLYVISFPAGVNVKEATTATYHTFQISSAGVIGSQIGNGTSVTVVPAAVADTGGALTDAQRASSCTIEQIGWIVCPISSFLATGMDNIFSILEGFLTVAPLSTETSGPLYQTWNIIRSIANVAFVIAFLIIIYSQLTNAGVSNYGLKKLLPRLVVSAILVNLSYFICSVAVDLSNITGSGLQGLLLSVRDTVTQGHTAAGAPSWKAITAAVLAGGTAAAGGSIAIGSLVIASGASVGAAVILLLPILLGLLVAIIVALLVLAARQAIIVLLIILAPLAFVAFLLPNTEKLFDKWRGLFITLLVFFPIFALLFGGSQLASFIIMQTVDSANPNAINVIILALFVQIAPLVITPLLVKFSGGLIGRIAGIVNNPSKGLINQTRSWSKERSQQMAARNMARQDPVRRRQVMRSFALGMDQSRRLREDRLTANKETSDARYANSDGYSNIQQQLRFAQDDKKVGTESANLRYESSRTTSAVVRNLDTTNRQLTVEVDNAKLAADVQWDSNHTQVVAQERLRTRVLKDQINAIHSTHDAEYEEFKNGRVTAAPLTGLVGAMRNQSMNDSRLLAINAMRSESAKRAVNETFTKQLVENTVRIEGQVLQTYAGGVQGIEGAQRALAAALSAQSAAVDTAIANATAILTYGNYSDATVTNIALGNNAGTSVNLTKEMRQAAIKKTASSGNTTELLRLIQEFDIDNSTEENKEFSQMFADTMLVNANRPKFAGATFLGNAKQGIGPAAGKARIDQLNAETINAGKFGADLLTSHDNEYLEALSATLANNLSTVPISIVDRQQIKAEIDLARSAPQYAGKIAERRKVLDKIYSQL